MGWCMLLYAAPTSAPHPETPRQIFRWFAADEHEEGMRGEGGEEVWPSSAEGYVR